MKYAKEEMINDMKEDGVSNCCGASVVMDMCMDCKEHCGIEVDENRELQKLLKKYCCYIDCPSCGKPSAFDEGKIEERLKKLGHNPFKN